ncbi:D-alanyl-D-alanine carboxypeptidase family protein [Heyndrickxia sp. NPDC080065]|uniref:D-alanyl-D-alanine carboxypeptidase family protein n=1 Tax=Heyndrickxia sp. NPDC080065 TaxID=3390568 RepID=UPI003D01F539
MKKTWIVILVFFVTFNIFNKVEASEKPKLTIASETAVLVDSKTGKVLYEKNAFQRMYPASLTKIATAIYAIENGNLNDKIEIGKNVQHTEGTKVYLVEGEQVTLKHLIQGLLINSGNDAGVAIAEYMNGSVSKFADQLNKLLINEVGVSATNFVNPHGLFDKDHYTTAYDLAKITNYAIKNKTFKKIFGTKELKWNGKEWKTTLITHHLMLRGDYEYKEVTGGKTGYVDKSGQTLATTAENKKIHLTVITMNAKTKRDAYTDTKKLLDYGFKHFETSSLPKGETFTVGGNVYKTPRDIVYTKPLNGAVSKDVSKDGILKIIDKKGDSLESYQLFPIQVKATHEDSVKYVTKASNDNKWFSFIIILLIILGAASIFKRIVFK